MLVALWGFGLGLLPTLFTTNLYFLSTILPVAFAAVLLIKLPYSVLMGFLPEEEYHGIGASLFSASRGVGIVFGAIIAGITVEVLRGVDFLACDQTQGYAGIFAVASTFLLASTPLLFKMNIDSRRRA